jgi:hypothetical protein
VVSVGYEDLDEPVPAATFDTLGLTTGCKVTVYTVANDKERPVIDEGTFTIGDADTTDLIAAPKLPIGQCAFDTVAKEYRCIPLSGAIPATSLAQPNGDGTYNLTINGAAPFQNFNPLGAHVIIEGFADPAYNSVPTDPKKAMFPIVSRSGATVITVLNPAVANAETVAGNMAKFTIVTGKAPVPTVALNPNFPSVAQLDFLGDNTKPNEISISKTKGAVVADFTSKLAITGEGFALAAASIQPFGLPQDALNDVVFDCTGTCGSKGGQIFGLLISGRTTDGNLAGTGPTDMPKPVTKFAEFQCRQINAEQIKLPKEAYAEILKANPTRIETRILHITADTTRPPTSIAAGHALVGYTDINPPTAR